MTPRQRAWWCLGLLSLLPWLSSCQERLEQEEPSVPFVFRSLNLRQQDAQGRPAWQLTSPEARYDLSRKLAQARELRGTIFSAGRPLYRLSATSGTVLNDGVVIQLEGLATLQRLGPQPLVIRARRVRWFPQQQRMELDRRPSASDRDLQISADRAVFFLQQDRLELRGSPTLSRLSPDDPIVVHVSRADWSPATGQITAPGPVRAVRQLPGSRPPQTLTSPFLRGDSHRQTLRLAAPVQFSDPGAKAQLLGGATSIDLARRSVVSREPFRGSIDRLRLAGGGFELLQADTLAVIPRACSLQQPEDTLTATRCQWNWSNQRIEARGSVVLERAANRQITRASQLDGRLGPDGLAVFSSPGGRVNTRVLLPTSAPSRGVTPARPATRSPIGL